MRTSLLRSVSLLLLVVGVAQAQSAPVKVSIPVTGLTHAAADPLKAELTKVEGIADVTVSDAAFEVTIQDGKGVGLSAFQAALKAASTAESPIRVDEAKLALAGVLEVVLATNEDDAPLAEGGVNGYFDASGEVTTCAVQDPAVKPAENATTTIVRVEFTPDEGSVVDLAGLKEAIATMVEAAPEGQPPFGVTDVRWGAIPPAVEEGK